jgi:hypothetical protein
LIRPIKYSTNQSRCVCRATNLYYQRQFQHLTCVPLRFAASATAMVLYCHQRYFSFNINFFLAPTRVFCRTLLIS